MKRAIGVGGLVKASNDSLEVWLEATAEQCQLCSVVESKRGSELVELHCVFQTGGSLLEAFRLHFSLDLQKLSKVAKESAKLFDKTIVVVVIAGVLFEVGEGPRHSLGHQRRARQGSGSVPHYWQTTLTST